MARHSPKIVSVVDHKNGFIYYTILYPNKDAWIYKLDAGHSYDVDILWKHSQGRTASYIKKHAIACRMRERRKDESRPLFKEVP